MGNVKDFSGVASAIALAASLVGGCSSDNGGPGDSGATSTADQAAPPTDSGASPADAGGEAGNDGATQGAGDAADAAGDGAACVPDADITMLTVPDASLGTGVTLPGCYACLQSTCMTQLRACNADCTCNGRIPALLSCLVSNPTRPSLCGFSLSNGDSAGARLFACLFIGAPYGCLSECSSGFFGPGDAGSD
jgi:hypothetical protein